MNLHQNVAAFVGAVNPRVYVGLQLSTGPVKNADYSISPGYATPGSLTASITGTTLTASAVSQGKLMVGQTLADETSAMLPNTQITAVLSGAGGPGVYTVNQSQTVSSETMTTSLEVLAQVQPLTTGDLRQVEALNLQGTHRTIYINGAAAGLVRVTKQGGDLVTLPDGSVWLVTIVPEQWPDWCHAVITLQDGS